ncbi:MAG: hypothetical protein K6E86_10345 [Bacteroidales bacterium]|nr:hypothetical protein [Bacteroidales bacterium]
MAKITTVPLIKSLQGLLGDQCYASYNSRTGQIYIKRTPVCTAPPTINQLKWREQFRRISKAVKLWFEENAPKSENDLGTPEYIRMHRDYLKQQKYATLKGYMFAQMMERE